MKKILLLLTILTTVSLFAQEGKYIKVKNSNCLYYFYDKEGYLDEYNPNNLTIDIKWTGDCNNGKLNGYGTLELRVDIDEDEFFVFKYTGFLQNGKEHGQGTATYSEHLGNGEVFTEEYIGEWKNGLFHGKGVLTDYAISVKNEGDWIDNNLHNGKSINTKTGKVYNLIVNGNYFNDETNPAEIYNLGVMAAESGNIEEAKTFYLKTIELNPGFADAYNNMAYIILSQESAIIEQMNSLGVSSADNKKYDELNKKRINLYKEAVPFLETLLKLQPNNSDVSGTLINIYKTISQAPK